MILISIKQRRSVKACLLALWLALATFDSTLAAPKILLNSQVKAQSLDTTYLNQIFAMQIRKWPDGSIIHVFVMPSSSSVHRAFVIEHLKTQAHQLDRIWNRMLFTGTGKPPTVVQSEREMQQMIQSTPGAIGYVSENFPAKGVQIFGGNRP